MMPLDLPPREGLQIAFLATFGIVWCFWLGAVLGSYLNVLVYRMPLGKGTVAPDSRCPKCQTRIRWYDNIPIYGWLALGGKCRACRQPISVRYLLVEVVLGSLFALLFAVEVLTGGANLPPHAARDATGTTTIEHLTDGGLLGIYAYHAMLVWFAAGIALFALDGHRAPRNFAIAALIFVVTPPIFWPELRPATEYGFPIAATNAALGVGAGSLFGYLLSLDFRRTDRLKANATTILLGALVGGALGWHAALVWFGLSAATWLLHLVTCYVAGRKAPLPLAAIAAASLLALLVGWGGFYEWVVHPIAQLEMPRNRIACLTIAVLLSFLAATIGGYLEERLNTKRRS